MYIPTNICKASTDKRALRYLSDKHFSEDGTVFIHRPPTSPENHFFCHPVFFMIILLYYRPYSQQFLSQPNSSSQPSWSTSPPCPVLLRSTSPHLLDPRVMRDFSRKKDTRNTYSRPLNLFESRSSSINSIPSVNILNDLPENY